MEYDYDWMHQVAKCLADVPEAANDMPDEIRSNQFIMQDKEFLQQAQRAIMAPKLKVHAALLAWHEAGNVSHLRFRLEPLLLTGATFETIAADLGGKGITPEVIQLYERLYFNVREDDGSLTDSSFIRMRASLPENGTIGATTEQDIVWKNVASLFGYTGLVLLWQMPNPHAQVSDDQFVLDELRRAAQAILMENMVRRQINNFDLNAHLSHYIDYKRMMHDTGTTQQVGMEADVLALFQAFAPKMLTVSTEVDKLDKKTDALQARMKAQAAISGHAIEDLGNEAGLKALHSVMNSHLDPSNIQ
jgi:hypothetical protein